MLDQSQHWSSSLVKKRFCLQIRCALCLRWSNHAAVDSSSSAIRPQPQSSTDGHIWHNDARATIRQHHSRLRICRTGDIESKIQELLLRNNPLFVQYVMEGPGGSLSPTASPSPPPSWGSPSPSLLPSTAPTELGLPARCHPYTEIEQDSAQCAVGFAGLPGSYYPNESCDWLLKTTVGKFWVFSFSRLDLETAYDIIQVFNGNHPSVQNLVLNYSFNGVCYWQGARYL